MNEYRPGANDIGRCERSVQRICEQEFAEARAVLATVNREARKQDDADRMLGEALGNASGRLLLADCSSGKGVVADDPAVALQDVGAGRIVLLIGQGETAEPVVQRRLSAVERRNIVIFRQLNDGGERLLGVDGATSLRNNGISPQRAQRTRRSQRT
jgi:hypothetical protein